MIVVESIGSDILIRGRNNDRTRYEKRIKSFKPYFYVRADEVGKPATHISLNGDVLVRVEVDSPKDVRKQRTKYRATFEADVLYANRYIIDNYYDKTIEAEPYRICAFDIETDDEESFPDISKANKSIISIAAHDNYTGNYYCFIYQPHVEFSGERSVETYEIDDGVFVDARVFRFTSEKEMLQKFIKFVNQMDFDIFYGWNADKFDYPYLFARMKQFNLSPEQLSPINQVDAGFAQEVAKPRGRVWMDLMKCYMKLSTSREESYTLEYISNKELGTGKVKHEEKICEMWRHDEAKLIKYNLKDVYLMVRIDQNRGIISYFDQIRRFTFCNWYDVPFNSRVLDFYYLRKAKEYGIVLPTIIHQKEHEEIEGAIVITPRMGVNENIAVCDVRSLYPSAIMICNLSPETLIGFNGKINRKSHENFIKVDDVFFDLEKRGFIPRVVEDLWNLRQQYKSKRNEYELGSHEYEMLDRIQTVLKFLLNSIYGITLDKKSRLYNRYIGKSVTYFGRRTNLWIQKKIKEKGSEVIGGDTDSVFFTLKSKNKEDMIREAQDIIDYVNSSLDTFCKEEFGDSRYNIMFVEFEKVYSKIIFPPGKHGEAAKKRYAGFIFYKDGKMLDEPLFDIKGFDAVRSDTPMLVRELQTEVLKMILNGASKEDVYRVVRETKERIINGEYDVDEIAFPCGISKALYDYTKTTPIHVTGAIYYNKYCGGHISSEKCKYVYIKETRPGLPKTHVISFTDEQPFPEGFTVDYNTMASKLIDEKFESIFACMGWNIHENDGIERFW